MQENLVELILRIPYPKKSRLDKFEKKNDVHSYLQVCATQLYVRFHHQNNHGLYDVELVGDGH